MSGRSGGRGFEKNYNRRTEGPRARAVRLEKFQKIIDRLRSEGRLPSLEEFLETIAEIRESTDRSILRAREKDKDRQREEGSKIVQLLRHDCVRITDAEGVSFFGQTPTVFLDWNRSSGHQTLRTAVVLPVIVQPLQDLAPQQVRCVGSGEDRSRRSPAMAVHFDALGQGQGPGSAAMRSREQHTLI